MYPSNVCPYTSEHEDGHAASDVGALGVAMVQLSDIFHFHTDAFEGAKMSDAISLALFMWIVEYLHEIGSK